jgi:hypothetical protein
MVLRWIAAGMGEAAKQVRHVTGTCTCPLRGSYSIRQSPPLLTPSKGDAAT